MVLRHERTEKSFDREDWFACEIKEIDYQREYTFTIDPANPSEETLMLGGLIFEGSMCLERTVKFVLAFYTSSNPDITNEQPIDFDENYCTDDDLGEYPWLCSNDVYHLAG